ncbi:MAG: FIG003003: hypothetical protein, partial [uncultured Gemmatimonadetes bacterium]
GRETARNDVRGDFGLDVRRVAGRVLSRGAGSQARAGLRRVPAEHHRDQRLVLLPSAPHQLLRVVRGHAPRLRLRRQGKPLHHPHEEA